MKLKPKTFAYVSSLCGRMARNKDVRVARRSFYALLKAGRRMRPESVKFGDAAKTGRAVYNSRASVVRANMKLGVLGEGP